MAVRCSLLCLAVAGILAATATPDSYQGELELPAVQLVHALRSFPLADSLRKYRQWKERFGSSSGKTAALLSNTIPDTGRRPVFRPHRSHQTFNMQPTLQY